MEFLSYESALLPFTLSSISCHHNSWSCIYSLFWCKSIFLNLSTFCKSSGRKLILLGSLSVCYCPAGLHKEMGICWTECFCYDRKCVATCLIVFLLCGVFISGVFQPLCSSISQVVSHVLIELYEYPSNKAWCLCNKEMGFPPTLFIFLFFRLSDFSRDEANESDLVGEGWGRNVLFSVYLQGALGRKCEK